MEKCSESTGINSDLNFFNSFSINDQPHTIDSLFAIANVFEYLIIWIVGFKPSIPEIALIVTSAFFFIFLRASSKL